MKSIHKISGMTCEGCKSTIIDKLSLLDGVDDIQVDLNKGKAIIFSKKTISPSLIEDTLPSKYKIVRVEDNQEIDENDIRENSKIKQLKPLFIILTYISITSILLNYKNWNPPNIMLDFMGLFYIIFSFFKILDVKGFSRSFRMYDPLAKRIKIYGYVYPFIEIILGILFLTRIEIEIALILTILFLGITTIGVTKIIINKRSIQCACLGTIVKLPMTEATLIENFIMISMAISLIF